MVREAARGGWCQGLGRGRDRADVWPRRARGAGMGARGPGEGGEEEEEEEERERKQLSPGARALGGERRWGGKRGGPGSTEVLGGGLREDPGECGLSLRARGLTDKSTI